MSSVQDHTPVVRELSDRRQQDPQSSPSEQPRVAQPRDPYDPPRAITSEAPREYSPPRFSQLLEAPDPHPPRTALSTGTNSVTLVNHPGAIGNPTNDPGVQNPSSTPERSQTQPILVSDRRPPAMYDPIRGDTVVQAQLSDDGDHGRGSSMRRVGVPRPRPVFSPQQDGNGVQNGSRTALRGISGGDSPSHPSVAQEPPQKTVEERIRPTLDAAVRERNKYKRKARIEGVMINGAIALQVIVGAITTGVAAGSKNVGSAVAVLGGISTGLASYLAKARGSGEPEFSNLRSRELSTFIREVEAFVLDKGHKTSSEFDVQVSVYRERFELIIKTEGEDPTSGTGYSSHSRGRHLTNPHSVPSQQQMAAMHGGGNGQLSEKQMWKNEKALGGIV